MHRTRVLPVLLALVGLATSLPGVARAVIERPLKLADVISTSDQILLVRVSSWQPDKPAAILTVEKAWKGEKPFERLAVRLAGDKDDETKQLLARLAADVPVVLFVTEFGGKPGCLAFTNGTWFQLVGETTADGIKWRFTHLEPYLRRTYKGTTDELGGLLPQVLAGKVAAPPLAPKEKPGVGPTLAEAQGK